MSMIDKAIELAVLTHRDRFDLVGDPFILHPLRVMLSLRKAGASEIEQVIGVLHDTLEEDPRLAEALAIYFPPSVTGAVQMLTRVDGEPYENYITRVVSHPTARKVKIHDLLDNLDTHRVKRLPQTTSTHVRLEKYFVALNILQSKKED